MKEFTYDYFKPHNFEKYLAHLKDKKGLKFLEVGSLEGRSACWCLDNFDCFIYCVDPGITDEVHYRLFENLTSYSCLRWRVERDLSVNVLPTLNDNFFDFAYIDGDHDRDAVMLDALLVAPLLKPGGILIFDDYQYQYTEGQDNPTSPHDAIDTFIAWHPAWEVLHKKWQAVLRKPE